MFLVVARAHGPGLDGLEHGCGVGCGLAGRKAIEARRLDDRRVVLILFDSEQHQQMDYGC